MVLDPGTKLGSYEILSAIGAGGMGEVYRARDTNLRRDVALKILPAAFAADADRVTRFEREAHILASLNHPNIAAIYGLERTGATTCLVMELVEGQTLAERIAKAKGNRHTTEGSVIPLDETLAIAAQIATALEAAHEKGIIHRDLKPANVIVTPEGKVKVLDFGLAKQGAGEAGQTGAGRAGEAGRAGGNDLSQSPTMHGGTSAGVILGTAAYMSPEQARGKTLDKRTDIWSFGCVLYEMLAGRPAFHGDTLTDIVAAVVKNEPDWSILPSELPAAIHSLLRRCLKKEPSERLHDVADARIEIAEAAAEPSARAYDAPHSKSRVSFARVLPWAITGLSVIALVITEIASRRASSPGQPVTRLELNLPAGVEIGTTNSPGLSFSPDGTRIAFVGGVGGLRRIYVRRLDEFETTQVKGTETASTAVFSPDGRALAFTTTNRALKTVSLADGLVTTIGGDVDSNSGGLSWGADGRITCGRHGALWQVPATGGPLKELTTLDGAAHERFHGWPTVVAGGKAILFTDVTEDDKTETHLDVISPDTGQRRRVMDKGSNPVYTAGGHLVFFREGVLFAAPFDAEKLEVTGPAVVVLDNISLDPLGRPIVTVSNTGSVAYVPSGNATKKLVWVSRQGVEQPISDISRPYQNPRLAPDGHRIVVEVSAGDLWIQDAERNTFTRATSEPTLGNTFSVWTPDGHQIVFRTLAGLHVINPDGGVASSIPVTTVLDIPTSISPDGETLAFIRQSEESGGDIYALSFHGDPQPRRFISTSAYDGGGQFSPDGRWMAYVSNESGQNEVYVHPYPGPDRKVLVSAQGGTHPKWNRNGKELFYRNGNRMLVVEVTTNPELKLSQPRVLFEQRYAFGSAQTIANYDVSPDGQRFLMVKDESSSGRLNIVLNWFEELKRLAPVPGK